LVGYLVKSAGTYLTVKLKGKQKVGDIDFSKLGKERKEKEPPPTEDTKGSLCGSW
jgi:hypothetical protein